MVYLNKKHTSIIQWLSVCALTFVEPLSCWVAMHPGNESLIFIESGDNSEPSMTPIGLDSRLAGEWLILRSFFSPISHSLMGKPIPWYPMLPWWSLPLPSFYPYIKTLVKLRLPDFPPEDLEATQPKNLVNAPPASPSSPQTSSRHSFRFRFGDDWNYTISIKDSKSATHCHCQQKTPRHVYIYMCIYIHIDIYTYTRKNICTVALYI